MGKEAKGMSENGCLDRYCNGSKVCTEVVEGTTDQYFCEAEWCEFHPNYKAESGQEE